MRVGLVAIGYTYNMRRVLFFLATEGAGGVHDGEPYVQRWADDLNNITTMPILPRPCVVSPYFARSPRVDNHNQSRHHDLVLEELWLTQDCWLRMHTTMAGIHVTNCWKLVKHHLPRHHPLKESTVVNFADPMCKAMIYNGLTGKVEPSRLTERVLADITNEPPPLRHNIMHPGKRPGNDNATTQARCTIYSAAGSAGCSAASAATSSRATLGYDVLNYPRAAIGYAGDDLNETHYETIDASEEVVNESGGADSDDEQEGLGGQDLPLDCHVQSLLVEPITGTPYTVTVRLTSRVLLEARVLDKRFEQILALVKFSKAAPA
eukprot:jgi/Tetstr1/436306/TSEL_025145.t1